MIQAKELRIGNWAYCPHGKVQAQIATLDKDNFELNLEPIPLTEELHLKFGAKKIEDVIYSYTIPTKRNVNIEIRFIDMDVYIHQGVDIILFWDCDYTLRDMYVHEWQNLYFSLTGEELTIKN